MLKKEEKKALTRIGLLSIGWGLGLDRFYDGKTKEGFLSLIGWGIIFGSLMFLVPCHGHDYAKEAKDMADLNPLIVLPLGLGFYGAVLIIKKGFRLLRQFETAED